jgi:predicted glycogen debranching enzyme
MSFIHFSKEQLQDLDFSLEREILQANNTGAYSSSSLINCNTRKYHGLLVVPQPQIDDNKFVLLSGMDETILQGVYKIKLGTHRYPNIYYPEGYYFLEEFSYKRIPEWIFKINDIILKKEIQLIKDDERVLIRYTVEESHAPFSMQFDPFLAFRNIHSLSKSNTNVSNRSEAIPKGIKVKMYQNFSNLFLQFSKKNEFVPAPDWHYNNEYNQERERGYDYSEDTYSPGYFNVLLKKGDQLVFSAGLSEINPQKLKTIFETQLKKHIPLQDFNHCLENAAKQFIVKTKKGTEIIAGFHWFGQWGRDTFIALPGLTLSTGHPKICKAVIDTMIKELRDGLFPNTGKGNQAAYNSADASLWFFWALQQYTTYTGSISEIWDEYGSVMKSILENYRNGTKHNIQMKENGLLFAGERGAAITWMDAIVDGKPVTQRIGMAVELNALWYNAIRFALMTASLSKAKNFISEWESIPHQIETSFKETFWDEEKKHLADCVNGSNKDWTIRPNQIITASLPYSPVSDEIKKMILETVKEKLLTPRGLRTLSPDDKNYKGIYKLTHRERDMAYHQGTVWPWLLGHFSEAYLNVYGKSGVPFIKNIYENFEPALFEYGIGSIAEIYDGNQPHKAKGAISQAWSVAELLRIKNMIAVSSKKESTKIKKSELLQSL